jgi:transposase InsO family protein
VARIEKSLLKGLLWQRAAALPWRAWFITPTVASNMPSGNYTDVLKERRIAISMSRKGNPQDNAAFLKTLKYGEVYRQEYRDLGEVLNSIWGFIERVYNERRLHSALGYRPPSQFEQMLALPAARVQGHTFLT